MALPHGNAELTITCAARDAYPGRFRACSQHSHSTFAVFRPKARTWYRTGIRTASTNGRNPRFCRGTTSTVKPQSEGQAR